MCTCRERTASFVVVELISRFVTEAGQHEKALRILSQLRHLPEDHEYVQREFAEIKDEIDRERRLVGASVNESKWQTAKHQISECMRPGIRWRISIGVVCQMIGQFSGINGINYYSPRIFRSLGVRGNNTSLFATGIYGVVKVVASLISFGFLVDRLGRRALLLGGCVVMAFSLFFVGAYIKVSTYDVKKSLQPRATSNNRSEFHRLRTQTPLELPPSPVPASQPAPSFTSTPWPLSVVSPGSRLSCHRNAFPSTYEPSLPLLVLPRSGSSTS